MQNHAKLSRRAPDAPRARAAVYLRGALLMLGALSAFGLAGCAGPGAPPAAQYDLGPLPDVPAASGAPALKVRDVSAPDAFDTKQIAYRLAYANAQRVAAYRDSSWSAPPAQLLTARLCAAFANRGTVLENGMGDAGVPVLKVELTEFEQVFEAPGRSHAAVAVRATLSRDGQVAAQRTLTARAPAATPDAAGGAQALAAASDTLIGELAAWTETQRTALKP